MGQRGREAGISSEQGMALPLVIVVAAVVLLSGLSLQALALQALAQQRLQWRLAQQRDAALSAAMQRAATGPLALD